MIGGYEIPDGAECWLIANHAHYIAACVHPDRRPWLVLRDLTEFVIPDGGVTSTEFDFMQERWR